MEKKYYLIKTTDGNECVALEQNRGVEDMPSVKYQSISLGTLTEDQIQWKRLIELPKPDIQSMDMDEFVEYLMDLEGEDCGVDIKLRDIVPINNFRKVSLRDQKSGQRRPSWKAGDLMEYVDNYNSRCNSVFEFDLYGDDCETYSGHELLEAVFNYIALNIMEEFVGEMSITNSEVVCWEHECAITFDNGRSFLTFDDEDLAPYIRQWMGK